MSKNNFKKKNLKSLVRLDIRSFHEWMLIIKMALSNLKRNKIRTSLTVLGVVIGVTSVVVVMSGGIGLKNFVLGQIEAFGSNFIQVEIKVPGVSAQSSENAVGRASGVAITTLKIKDAEEIKKSVPNIKAFNAGNIDQEFTVYRDVTKRVMLFGNSPDAMEVDQQIVLQDGDFFSEGDNASAAQVAVLGSQAKKSFFGDEEAVGESIKIKNLSFKVIGVLKERGTAGFFNFDDVVYVPITTMNKKLLGIDYLQYITFVVKDPVLIEETALDVKEKLRELHDIKSPEKEDFSVQTAQEARQIINSVFKTINYLLIALTSISLIVGGVGIMNVMYVSVTERTREIGLRKAVGARDSAILRQFLFEAVVITSLGGIIGILIGIGSACLLNGLIRSAGFNLVITLPLNFILVAAGFSVFIGIIFGMYPAWKASGLSPLEALRND